MSMGDFGLIARKPLKSTGTPLIRVVVSSIGEWRRSTEFIILISYRILKILSTPVTKQHSFFHFISFKAMK
jgi:hypothetical protein